jgi:hypothetical protein
MQHRQEPVGGGLGGPEPALDPDQYERARARDQPAAVGGGAHRLARDRQREGAPLVPFLGALHGGSG